MLGQALVPHLREIWEKGQSTKKRVIGIKVAGTNVRMGCFPRPMKVKRGERRKRETKYLPK